MSQPPRRDLMHTQVIKALVRETYHAVASPAGAVAHKFYSAELEMLSGEVHRVLRPGGLHVYTVRHTSDVHYGAGISHGDGMFENGGFIVHFFDRALVDRLTTGFTLLSLTPFEEGSLPRRLWRITLRREDTP